jgi:hypothetical protein
MSNYILMSIQDLEVLLQVVKENNVSGVFKLVQDNSSGIGYSTDIEFDKDLHGRLAVVRVPIAGSDNW